MNQMNPSAEQPSHHHRHIDWLNHALEFLVVVVGILLAFQLDNYAQSLQQEKTLDAHRMGVMDETKLNQAAIQYALNEAQSNAQKLTDMLQLIEADDSDPAIINQMALELMRADYAYIKKNAYSTLTQSGDIRFMSFHEKTRVINLYEYYAWIESVQRQNLTTHQNNYIAMVQKNLDMRGQDVQPLAFYRTKSFINAVLTYHYGLQYKISKYQDCLAQVKAFLAASETSQAAAA